MSVHLLSGRARAFWLALLLGLSPSLLLAQAESEEDEEEAPLLRVEAGTAEDLEDYEAAAARYEERSLEFDRWIRGVMRARIEAEIADTRAGFDRFIDRQALEAELYRDTAIEELESFLSRYGDHPQAAHRMFRLALLYGEESEERYIDELVAYAEQERAFDEGMTDILPVPPQKDYDRSLRLYKRIVRQFAQDYDYIDAVYYMMAWVYTDEESVQADPDRARETFETLVAERPDSEYAPTAYLQLGEYYFDQSQMSRAIAYFREVYENYRDSDDWDKALYKLAWAHYKSRNLEESQRLFVELVDYQRGRLEQGDDVKVNLTGEAIKYIAISLADRSEENDEPAFGFALAFFEGLAPPTTVSERAWQEEVLVELAEILRLQSRNDEAIVAYTRLQEMYPEHPDNPEFANRVAELYYTQVIPDVEASRQARALMTERYYEGSPWWNANLGNSDALNRARELVLGSLRDVALDYHARAQNTGEASDYLAAAEKYREYLGRFPGASDSYRITWFLAECYFWAGEYERAISEYESLFGYPEINRILDEESEEGPTRREVQFGVVVAYERLLGTATDFRAMPESWANRREELAALTGPQEVEGLELSSLMENYVAAVDRYLGGGGDQETNPVLLYRLGEIYHYHNQFSRAEVYFNQLIEDYPRTIAAARGAGLLIDQYTYLNDLVALNEQARRLAALDLGPDGNDETGRRDAYLDSVVRTSTFGQADYLYEQGEFARAAELYESYADNYDNDEDAYKALYNAAGAWEDAGDVARANGLYERLLADYSDSPVADSVFWRMAGVYERVLDLDTAVGFYLGLVQNRNDSQLAPDALANAGFLLLGMKEWDQAASLFERYADEYADVREDAPQLFMRAAQTYRESEQSERAERAYQAYLDRYADYDTNRTMEAQAILAELAEERGDTEEAFELYQQLVDFYGENRDSLDPRGVRAAARARFQILWRDYEEYRAYPELPDDFDNPEAISELLEEKAAIASDLRTQAETMVANYLAPTWQSAGLFLVGAVLQEYADWLFRAPCPRDQLMRTLRTRDEDIIEEACLVYEDTLRGRAEPFETAAIEGFQRVIDTAREFHYNNEWVDRARAALHEIDSSRWPVFKYEQLELIESDTVDPPAPLPTSSQQSSAAEPDEGRVAEGER